MRLMISALAAAMLLVAALPCAAQQKPDIPGSKDLGSQNGDPGESSCSRSCSGYYLSFLCRPPSEET
jgi:hypothetical protein